MALEITFAGHVIPSLSSSFRNFRQALEENLFDNDYKGENCECDSGYCKHRSEGAFEKISHEEMSEISFKEYPVRAK